MQSYRHKNTNENRVDFPSFSICAAMAELADALDFADDTLV